MDRQIIYIAAYPRSGSTWFTRLLADVLNSPSGGCIPEEDATDPATSGQGRKGAYFIRRGHFVLVDNDTGPVVPQGHHLAWKQLVGEHIIFLVRDPRDICVSGAHHWQVPVGEFLRQMIDGEVAGLDRWDEYCKRWIYHSHWKNGQFVHTRYIDLQRDGIFEMKSILKWLGARGKDVTGAFKRQSFQTYQALPDDNELKQFSLRRGVAGDWRNYFTPEMNERIWNEFGKIMERVGYAQS